MTPNPDWQRWIYSSVAKHFSDIKQQVPFYIEGQQRPTNINDFAELRIGGPYFNEVSHAVWEIEILIAIIINIIQDDSDLYKIDRYTGIYSQGYTLDIPIYKYGDGLNDDGLGLMCLSLSPKTNEKIKITKFGQIVSGTNVAQTSIEATYQTKYYTPFGTTFEEVNNGSA